MTDTINVNQFSMAPIKGQLAKDLNGGVVAGVVTAAAFPGDPVKLGTGAYNKPIPTFTPCSTSEEPFGVIIYNARKSTMVENDACEVAFCGGPVVWMESAAAITAGVQVELANAANITVQLFTAGKQLGVALDGASAAGQLVRVIITKPTFDV